jgi:hypothetical protein
VLLFFSRTQEPREVWNKTFQPVKRSHPMLVLLSCQAPPGVCLPRETMSHQQTAKSWLPEKEPFRVNLSSSCFNGLWAIAGKAVNAADGDAQRHDGRISGHLVFQFRNAAVQVSSRLSCVRSPRADFGIVNPWGAMPAASQVTNGSGPQSCQTSRAKHAGDWRLTRKGGREYGLAQKWR